MRIFAQCFALFALNTVFFNGCSQSTNENNDESVLHSNIEKQKTLSYEEVLSAKINIFKDKPDFNNFFGSEKELQKELPFLAAFTLSNKDKNEIEKNYSYLKRFVNVMRDPKSCPIKAGKTLQECQQEEVKIILELASNIKKEYINNFHISPELPADYIIAIFTAYFVAINDTRMFTELNELAELVDNDEHALLGPGEEGLFAAIFQSVKYNLNYIFK